MSGKDSDRVRFGPFEADLHTHELWNNGTRVKLLGHPFAVLSILLSRAGELVTREELRACLWPADTFVDFNHGLNAAVKKLRETLGDSAEDPQFIETLPRRGYRFIATAEWRTLNPPAITPVPSVNPPVVREIPPRLQPAQNREAQPVKGRSRQPYFLIGTLAFVLAAIFLFEKVSSSKTVGTVGFPVQRITLLTNLADETSDPAFSLDGNFVAFRRRSGKADQSGIFVKALQTDQLIQLTRGERDCCPVWSPDRRSIAFSRFTNGQFSIYVTPFSAPDERRPQTVAQLSFPVGNQERKLQTGAVVPQRGELDWSPDGRNIAFDGDSAIYLLSIADSSLHRLTDPEPLVDDWGPSFSPDGKRILFVRGAEARSSSEIMEVPLSSGEPTRIVGERNRVLGPPRWSSDGRSIIFSSDQGSHPALWRVPTDGSDPPVEINDTGWYPAVSHRGFRLAYQRTTRNLSIWQMDLSHSSGQQSRVLLPATSETDQGPGPQFSPDGKKLAYMSDRSGTMEIWVSDRDGSNPVQLSAVGDAGTPRWSPDSRAIAFDGRGRWARNIYVVSLLSGEARPISAPKEESVCPSWSHDGKWIYFAADTTGKWQVWKAPSGGGPAVQVTRQGGHAPLASQDGKYIYYAKTPYANPEIWQVPVEGGVERLLSPLVRPATWASWSVVEHGIVFARPSGTDNPVVSLYDFTHQRVSDLGVFNMVPFWLSATRDGNTIVFDQPGFEQAQIMVVDNFQ